MGHDIDTAFYKYYFGHSEAGEDTDNMVTQEPTLLSQNKGSVETSV
jgi:hypothetical protein